MGSWWEFSLAGALIESGKSYVDSVVVSLFLPTDKRVIKNTKVKQPARSTFSEPVYTCYQYAASCKKIKQRLQIRGINDLYVHYAIKKAYKKQSEFRFWIKSVESFFQDLWKLDLRKSQISNIESLAKIHNINPEYNLGFRGEDFYSLIYILCDLIDDDYEFILDYTSPVEGGYYTKKECLYEICHKFALEELNLFEKIIILTEGSQDTKIIQEAMRIINPELLYYYSFLDFHSLSVEGGVGSLVKSLKMLSSCDIKNRIIAIFDNDSAARDATRSLENLNENIRLIYLPHFEKLKNYPTIGPQGKLLQNINELAASTELYLGDNLLKDSTGEYVPIQWSGYVKTLNSYQGEIQNKSAIVQKFFEIMKSINSASELPDFDFSGLELVLEQITYAFKES